MDRMFKKRQQDSTLISRLKGRLSLSIADTMRKHHNEHTTADDDQQNRYILENGRPGTKYYETTVLKQYRRKIARKRYNPVSLIKKSTTTPTIGIHFDQDDAEQNPLNIKVVNISKKNMAKKYDGEVQNVADWIALDPEKHVYIGKEMAGLLKDVPTSKWKCDFRCSKNINKSEICCLYELHVRNTPSLWNDLSSLENKILGCTCSGRYDKSGAFNLCHGYVLRYLTYAIRYGYDDGGLFLSEWVVK